MNRTASFVAVAILAAATAAAASQTQHSSKKAPAKSSASPAEVAIGKAVFQQKCSVCHYDSSDAKKIGPGLKGLNKRGTFTVNGNKVTNESLKEWIDTGDTLMPPFKEVLTPEQLKAVVAYVRTL